MSSIYKTDYYYVTRTSMIWIS